MTRTTEKNARSATVPAWLMGRGRRTGLVGISAAGLILAGATAVMAANPPAGPGNIEIFPDRDMVAIDGYSAQAGQSAVFEVRRGGNLIGVARGVVDGTGFYEINHPGGSCWDVVTPDIRGGDLVTVTFEDGVSDGATTGSAAITSVEPNDLPATADPNDAEWQVVVKGGYGADVDTARLAVEIVNPAMREAPSRIGERAIGWPADDAPTGYTVDGVAENGEFTVTYGFYSAADRALALAGAPTALSWLADATGVEAQLGLTLAEFGEISGPGFGGCPAGPATQGPSAPTDVHVQPAGDGSITASWTAATVPADANPITGYELIAEDTVLGQEVSIKVGANATSASLRGLVNGQTYPITVVALNGQASAPASGGTIEVGGEAPAEPGAPGAPTGVTVEDAALAGQVRVSWTAPAANGTRVTGYTVQALAEDGTVAAEATAAAGGSSANLTGLTPGSTYSVVVTATSATGNTAAEPTSHTLASPDLTAPSAPHVVRVQPGNGTATVEWQAATAGNTPVTGYKLTATPVYPAVPAPAAVETGPTGTSGTLTGLSNSKAYTIDVVATSAAGDSPSATFGPTASKTVTPADQLTATAELRTDRGEWRLAGSATVTTNNTITAKNSAGVTIGTAQVQADGSWTIRPARNSTAGIGNGKVTVTSSAGGSITITATTK
ncbi:fibronectin type III domain-containing protein [Georgenia yuyongxinii]|uniref:Fibronectin type III domain-containing protein n=1 Tax=Georgenia yuyongxinii TaxID=2589797 RepID=A0A552WLZ0_9MICO|nr:fibronectin type III domain-containing protein [Georgenia yuyongxinii]TRW43791.1 fibronectin type III domain-containing protein [Georgenia yuyongxinii]